MLCRIWKLSIVRPSLAIWDGIRNFFEHLMKFFLSIWKIVFWVFLGIMGLICYPIEEYYYTRKRIKNENNLDCLIKLGIIKERKEKNGRE